MESFEVVYSRFFFLRQAMSNIAKESILLAKHSIIYGTGTVISSVVAILLLPIYTRYLTPTDYGIKELIGLTVDIVGILLATAVSSGVLRFYFEYDDEKDRNEVISAATIGLSALAFTAFLVLSFFTKPMAGYIIDSPELYYYFNISLVSMWLNSVNDVGFGYLRARQKSVLFVLLSLFRMLVTISLNIYFIVFLKLGVLGVLLSTLIVAVMTTCLLNIPILFIVGVRFSRAKLKELVRFGLPSVPAQMGAFIVHLSDRFFLKAFCSIADTGIYSLGYRFGTIPGTFISVPFNQIWQPRRFELYKQQGSEELFGRIFTYYLALISFVGLGVAVLTREVLMIMADPKYWSAYAIVPIIIVANIIYNTNSHINMGILIQKKTKYFAYIDGSNGVFILLLNFLLIPRYGIFGAAYATLIAFIYKTILYYYFSSRIYRIYFEFIRIFKIAGSAVFLFVLCMFLEIDNVYASFVIKGFILLWFPVVLWGLGFYSQEEKAVMSKYMNALLSNRG